MAIYNIYNSRNFNNALNGLREDAWGKIYNSRNFNNALNQLILE